MELVVATMEEFVEYKNVFVGYLSRVVGIVYGQ